MALSALRRPGEITCPKNRCQQADLEHKGCDPRRQKGEELVISTFRSRGRFARFRQKYSFNASCPLRGLTNDEYAVTFPKFALPRLTSGAPKFGWLNTLKNSARNSMFIPSRHGRANRFPVFRSVLNRWGPVISPRPAFPTVYCAG